MFGAEALVASLEHVEESHVVARIVGDFRPCDRRWVHRALLHGGQCENLCV